MKNFNNSESFIVSEDIVDIIDPLSLTSGEDSSISEYFCYLREDSKKDHKCKISAIEKFSDDSIEIELVASESLVASLLSSASFSEVDVKIGERLLLSTKGQDIVSNFSIKFSSGNFHTVALTIYQSQ